MEEQFYTITKHADDVAHQERRDEGRPHHRARMRGLVERRRLCRHRSARHAEIGLHRGRARTTSRTCSIDSYALYTNLPPAGALRGFGIPQLVWAYESHTDMIARALGMDPLEFRRRNILREGRPQATGTLMRDAAIEHGARAPGRAHGLGRSRSIAAAARSAAAAASRSASRRASRRRPRSPSSTSTPTAAAASIAARSTWGRAPTPRWRRSPPKCSALPVEIDTRGASRHRRHALRHGDARLALDLPHGPRREARGGRRARQAACAGARARPVAGDDADTASCSARNTACRRATSSASAASFRPTRRPITTPGSPPTSRRSG